jgi:hypothetical protein
MLGGAAVRRPSGPALTELPSRCARDADGCGYAADRPKRSVASDPLSDHLTARTDRVEEAPAAVELEVAGVKGVGRSAVRPSASRGVSVPSQSILKPLMLPAALPV